MGQGQLRVIIWTTLVVLPYTMLHTKFQGHWSIGSGEEDFLRFLPYMGMAAMLVMWSRSFEQLFFPKGPGGCIWNLVAIGPVVSEEKSFVIVDGRRTDDGRRTTEPAYTISSPGAFGSGELKTVDLCHMKQYLTLHANRTVQPLEMCSHTAWPVFPLQIYEHAGIRSACKCLLIKIFP